MMILMDTKTTSKTSCLKNLLLKAWRERWTDVQWGKNIKTVLPRGVSGDVYNLADCILQQALVGSGANQLVLSYLLHSLSSQLVSHAAVLQGLSKFTQYTKLHCVWSLLEFLEKVLPGVTYCGKSDETKLASALLAITNWLLQVFQHCITTNNTNVVAGTVTNEQLTDKTALVFQKLLSSHYNIAMMVLAKYNDTEMYADICRRCRELESLFDRKDVLDQLQMLVKLDVTSIAPKLPEDTGPGSSVQPILAIMLSGNPDYPTQVLADKLRLIGRLKQFHEPRLYCDLIRACLQTTRNVAKTPHEGQWGAFTVLKMPLVLAELLNEHQLSLMRIRQKEIDTPPTAVFEGMELFLKHPTLLDMIDVNSQGSTLECILQEFAKVCLLNEQQVKRLLDIRAAQTPPLRVETSLNAPQSAPIMKMVLGAETTLPGILKALSSDYSKIQDLGILGMLHQVLAGTSFEIILAVATVRGHLRTLAHRLIRFNECSNIQQACQPGDKARAQIFDITFLMFIAIVQNYGPEAVCDPNSNGDSVLEIWLNKCMVEAKRPKNPDGPLQLCDPNYVEMLLKQFNSGESEFKAPVKWQDVVFNIPGVMKEVLVAWEQEALLASDVKRILDAIRGQMWCLPLAAAAWLCNYIRTAPHDTILKPINMVQQLLNPPTITDDEDLRERWQLTCQIIQKMQRDIQLLPKPGIRQLISKQPASEQLKSMFETGVYRGWLENKGAQLCYTLYETAGPRWLVASTMRELLNVRTKNQLEKAVDLAVGIFHTDIKQCVYHLLTDTLPELLLSNNMNAKMFLYSETANILQMHFYELMEPQLSAVSKLTAYCVYLASAAYETTIETEESDMEPPMKIARRNESSDLEKNPILLALKQLLTSLETAMQDGSITQQMYFTFHLLRYLVQCKPPENKSTPILKAIPQPLISHLLRTLPESFTSSMILQLSDINTTSGRSTAARDLCVLRNYELRHAPNLS